MDNKTNNEETRLFHKLVELQKGKLGMPFMPVAIRIYERDGIYGVKSHGMLFRINEPRGEWVDGIGESEEFINEDLEIFCIQYINEAKNKDEAAVRLLKAQLGILKELYVPEKYPFEDYPTTVTMVLYALLWHLHYMLQYGDGPLSETLKIFASFILKYIHEVAREWEDNYNCAVHSYFI